ncbi:hypothetical protein GCM10020256_07310 [Streptomyces thermocoprophilus]
MGDPGPDGQFVGWADRFAVLLADRRPEGAFQYTNLAVRGKLLDQIVADQVPQAVAMAPDLVSFCAGGNDIIRPGTDPDEVAERFERAVAQLAAAAGTVMVTTGFDTRGVPLLKHLRGKIATYNGHVRAIADRYGCPVLDLWSLKSVQDRRAWDDDRLHLSPEGHTRVALRAGQVLGLDVPGRPRAAVAAAAAARHAGGAARRRPLGARVPGAVDRPPPARRVLRRPCHAQGHALPGGHQEPYRGGGLTGAHTGRDPGRGAATSAPRTRARVTRSARRPCARVPAATRTPRHQKDLRRAFRVKSGAPGERQAAPSDPYSNQSNRTVPSAAYMPMTRPVKPPVTSVDR